MSASSDPPTILSFAEARHVVEEQAASVRAAGLKATTEFVSLLDALGRVLAEPVSADRDIPPFPRSTRDGYAVLSADLTILPATLEVIGEIKAGAKLEEIPAQVGRGQAASIMTGAPVPAGADAVVMVEYASAFGEEVRITRGVTAGENIVPRGAEAQQGSLLLDCGQRLNHVAIALAASVGKSKLAVFKRPRVAVLTTGDEIVSIDDTPGPTQIRNSNTYSLAAQIQQAGGVPVLLPVAPDEAQGLRRLIEQGLQADLLLMTGGVSMGRYDLVERVLAELHAEFFFTGAQIQPGRPVVFGRCGAGALAREAAGEDSSVLSQGKYFFGLPGNPVSTMVTFELFARPMIEALTGQSPRRLMFLHVPLKTEIHVKLGLTRFLPALLTGEFENSVVEPLKWQGSGDIAAIARANCYIVIPPDKEKFAAGEFVPMMLR